MSDFNDQKRTERIQSYLLMIEMRMEEKFKNIGQAFRTFDTDGDSRITFEEFWKGLTNVGIIMEKDTCKELFDYLDENGDRIIEFNEFCDFFETLQDRKGDYQKYSKNETQNCILESIRRTKGTISKLSLLLKQLFIKA